MTSLQQIQVSLDLRVLQRLFGQLESAHAHKDVEGMLGVAMQLLTKLEELETKLRNIYDSAEYMHAPKVEE